MPKKIFLFSRDPGGSNTIIPLVAPLINKGYQVELYGKDFALKRYAKFGLIGKDIESEINCIDEYAIKAFLKGKKIDFIITGTSGNDFTERFIWKASRDLNIPSLAILDHWINYGIRFSKYSVLELGKYEKDKQQIYLPFKIAVMDEYSKNEIIKDGVDSSLVVVTGQPYFELLKKQKLKFLKNRKKTLLTVESDFLISFISEAVSISYKNNYWGYTEKTIFNEFLNALNVVISKTNKKITVIIKIHPRESLDFYLKTINFYDKKKINFVIDDNTSSWELICRSDLICGMVSMFLIEAVILNKPALSIQIGLKRKNCFFLDAQNILRSILDQKSLIVELKKIIIDKDVPKYKFDVIKNPVEKILSHLERNL